MHPLSKKGQGNTLSAHMERIKLSLKALSLCISIFGGLLLYVCLYSFLENLHDTSFYHQLIMINASTTSLINGQNIYSLIAHGLSHTFWLTLWTLLIVYPLAFILALCQRHDSLLTKTIWYSMALLSSTPTCLMFVLLTVLNFKLGHLNYPFALAITLLVIKRVAPLATFIRNCLVKAEQQPYIQFAHRHSIPPYKCYFVYYLPEVLQPLCAKAPKQLVSLLCGGTAIAEMLCSIDGLGRISLIAMKQFDYPVIIICLSLQTLAVGIAYHLGDTTL